MHLHLSSSAPAGQLAARELARCLAAIDPAADLDITLGTFADLGLAAPAVADAALDDACHIRLAAGKVTIAGTNPRSILLGAYRLLKELGCRWLFPGKEGEILPRRSLRGATVSLDEAASFRHRVVCIEGAPSLTNVLDMIAWLPTAGFNGFYMQFREGYQFFERWYSHKDHPQRERKTPIDRAMATEFTHLAERAITERALLYHAVGHGWQCEAFGVPGIGWMVMGEVAPEFRAKAALVAGEREVVWGVPMLTALCYSDPEVQQAMTRQIADYAQANPDVHYLHVWLDDCSNQKCECPRCQKKRLADWYIDLLNVIDAELTKRNLPTKIVFLSYSDLLFPPTDAASKFTHPDRFVFMYANSRGRYTQPLRPSNAALPRHVHNQMPTDANSPDNVAAFLQAWKKQFAACDSFIFEYYGGAETFETARTVHGDIRALPQFGLNGIVNCQALRVFFPTGIGMHVLGQTLWNKSLGFDEQVDDYLVAAFGHHAAAVKTYLSATQQHLQVMKDNRRSDQPAAQAAADQLNAARQAFSATLGEGQRAAQIPAQRISWRMLEVYDAGLARAIGIAVGPGGANTVHTHGLRLDLFAVEDELQPWLEPGRVIHMLR